MIFDLSPAKSLCNTLLLQRRDAVIVATGNVLTAFFAGFVIFGIIGFMAFELGTTVDQVATQGNHF